MYIKIYQNWNDKPLSDFLKTLVQLHVVTKAFKNCKLELTGNNYHKVVMSRRSVGKELNTMEINQDNISNILVNNTKFNKVRKYEDFS